MKLVLRILTFTISCVFLLFLYFFYNSILSCILLNLSSFIWKFHSDPLSLILLPTFLIPANYYIFDSRFFISLVISLMFPLVRILYVSSYLIKSLSIHLPKILSINFLSFFSNYLSLLPFFFSTLLTLSFRCCLHFSFSSFLHNCFHVSSVN
jgi:hypothetical protein